MKTVSALALFVAGLAIAAPPVFAQNGTAASGHAAKKSHVHKHSPKKHDPAKAAEPEPEIAGKLPVDFNCELGDKLTVYRSASDDQHIALRWHKHLEEMTRVSTTTGAERFENAATGLVWIGIPAKSMLLDSKKGQQLANECRDAEQEAALRSAQPVAVRSR